MASADLAENAEALPEKTQESLFYAGLSKKSKRKNTADKYAIGVSASGIGSSSSRVGAAMAGPSFNDPFYSSDIGQPGFAASGTPVTEIRHYQPIRFGLTLQYQISDRIGIETGLVYSRLGSDISIRHDNLTAMGTRNLHYIGIPLNVKFSAWSWKFIGLYLSAGVTGEKCISNRFETASSVYGLSLDAFSRQKDKPFQWSVNAAPGIQVCPIPNIGIFAEPGVSYYFNDGTSLATIYKDHPLSFTLNLGIRLTLNP